MADYGNFAGALSTLSGNLSEVRATWDDPTAASFDSVNDNMEHFTRQVEAYYNNSISGLELVRANYNESEYDGTLNTLSARLDAV